MDLDQLKAAVESWIFSNSVLIENHSVTENESFLDINIRPKKNDSSSVSISVSKGSFESDISVGQFTQICNYKLKSIDDVNQVLNSVKSGHVTEIIHKILGMRAKVEGKLVVNNKTLTDTGYVFPLELLVNVFESNSELVSYKPW